MGRMKEYLEYIREDEFLDFVDDNDGNKIIESFNSKEDLVSVEEEIKNYKSLFNKYPKSLIYFSFSLHFLIVLQYNSK